MYFKKRYYFFQLTFCFWMNTNDLTNYGTVLSYAIENEDNELTFTDYGGFVLSVKGQKVVTDITGNSRFKEFQKNWQIFHWLSSCDLS